MDYGKGVATFAGMILAYDVRTLFILLMIGILFMAVTDFGPWGPVSAAILFPAWLLFRVHNLMVFGGVAAVGGIVIYKHKDNFARNRNGDEMHVSDFAEKYEELHHI